MSIICAIVFEEIAVSGLAAGITPILYAGILSVGIAYTMQIIGQKGVEPTKAAIILSLETMFSAIGGAVILGEAMSLRGYIGSGFIFAGIIASQITIGRKKVVFAENK